jgi:hypothetical protein
MSNSGFVGRAGFFGPIASYSGAYDPSVYRKYSRGGGSQNAAGTLAKAFAYKRPVFSDGGAADDPHDSDIQNIETATQPSQPRRPGQVEGMMQAMNQWGQGPSGVSHRFANAGLYDIQRANEVTPRRLAHGGGCTCWRCGGRFARGGQAKMTPAWKDRPFAVSQNTRVGHGLRINAPHPGHRLVLNIHLSNVGPHALSLSHSGGVDASRMVERMAAHRLAAERSMTTPFS